MVLATCATTDIWDNILWCYISELKLMDANYTRDEEINTVTFELSLKLNLEHLTPVTFDFGKVRD